MPVAPKTTTSRSRSFTTADDTPSNLQAYCRRAHSDHPAASARRGRHPSRRRDRSACASTSPRPARRSAAPPDAPRLAAALVHVAPPDPRAGRALPADHSRHARLRLVGGAAARLRQARRWPTTSSHLLDALELDRVRLMGHDWGGWCGFLMCMKRAGALRALPRAQHPAAWGTPQPAHRLETWRFWYSGAGQPDRRLARARTPATSAPTFAPSPRGRTSGPTRTSRPSPPSSASRERAGASRQLYRSFITREFTAMSSAAATADNRLTRRRCCSSGWTTSRSRRCSWTATTAPTPTTCGSIWCRTSATSSPRRRPRWSNERALRFFAEP